MRRGNTTKEIRIALVAAGVTFALGLLVAPGAADSASAVGSGDLECLIQPQQVVRLASAVEGLLESVNVDRGTRVSKGEVVATLESASEKSALDLARQRAQQQGQVAEAQARVEFSQRELARIEKLRAQNIVADRLFDEAQTNLKRSTADLVAARENMALAKLEMDRAEALLDRRRVRSPIDGVVTRRLLQPGEYVDNKQILEIAQIDPLRVEVLVPATLYGQVKLSTEALVTVEEASGRPFPARVTVVDPVIDAASTTFGVRLELPNADRSLPAGLKCHLRFVTDVAGTGTSTAPAAQAP